MARKRIVELGYNLLTETLPAWLKEAPFRDPKYVVGILNGGAPAALHVAAYYKVPILWMKYSSYGKKKVSEDLTLEADLTVDISLTNKRILIVDDIYDTGKTLHHAVERLWSSTHKIDIFTLASKKEAPFINNRPVHYLSLQEEGVWLSMPWERA